MSGRSIKVETATGTVTAANATNVIGKAITGLAKYDWFILDFTVSNPTGATLDVFVQRKIEADGLDEWRDWIRLPSLASAAGTKRYTATISPLNAITEVKGTTEASPATPTLAANTNLGGHPGDKIRLVASAATSAATGSTQTMYVTFWDAEV